MIIDCHVHLAANTPGHGIVSPRLMNSLRFRLLQTLCSLRGAGLAMDRAFEAEITGLAAATRELDAVVLLAFDAVYDSDGRFDPLNTHLYTTNAYTMEVVARHPKLLFGASIHPYRKDAVVELEKCVRGGAVLLKWLPITQNFNPADDRCVPFYEALAHYHLPLLSHTGGEQMLPQLDASVADPMLLVPALKRGVTVIAAHCGTKAHRSEPDYLPQFMRLAEEYENFYGDTSALNLPARWYAFKPILENPRIRQKLVHGSDWPILPLAPPALLGWAGALGTLAESNWLRRDILIKQQLGFDAAYWHRGGTLLARPLSGVGISARI